MNLHKMKTNDIKHFFRKNLKTASVNSTNMFSSKEEI